MANQPNNESTGRARGIMRVLAARPRASIFGAIVLASTLVVAVIVVTSGGEDNLVLNPEVKSAVEEEVVLDADDATGSPHLVLSEAFDPDANPEARVPGDLGSDADDILEVEEASFEQGSGPYDLVWKVERTEGEPVACINCAFVDERVKRIIKAALDSDAAEGITRIIGLDVTRTLAGDFAGNGWQVEFVVGSSASGYKNGEELATWILANSKEHRVFSLLWRNLLYTEADSCSANLESVMPVEAFPQEVSESDDVSVMRDAGMDRVVVASPSYTPQFEARDGAQFVTGWKATGC